MLVVSGIQTVLNGGLHVFLLGAKAGLNGLLRLRVVRRGLKRRLEQLFGVFVNGLHARGQALALCLLRKQAASRDAKADANQADQRKQHHMHEHALHAAPMLSFDSCHQ